MDQKYFLFVLRFFRFLHLDIFLLAMRLRRHVLMLFKVVIFAGSVREQNSFRREFLVFAFSFSNYEQGSTKRRRGSFLIIFLVSRSTSVSLDIFFVCFSLKVGCDFAF